MGALIGSGGRARLEALVPFGVYLGAAFQIRDDLDNLASEDPAYGKDRGCDIVEGKRTLPLLHVLSHHVDRASEVRDLVAGKGPATPRERVERVLGFMRQAGSLEYARNVADTFVQLAIAEAPKAFRGAVDTSEVDYICELTHYLGGAVKETPARASPSGAFEPEAPPGSLTERGAA